MRVLLVHEPPDGGVAEHVRLLALGLRERGYEPEVAGPETSRIAGPLRAAGIAVHTVPLERSYRRPGIEVKAPAAILRLARRRDVELIHAHSSKAGVHARIAARLAGLPSVYTPNCFGFDGPVGARRKLAATVIERSLAPITGRILCVSEAERRLALERHVASGRRLQTTMQAIPDAVPEVDGDPALAALRAQGPLVGAVNVLRTQKRNDVLIDAIPQVWERHPEARFVIVGSGPEEAPLRARAAERGLLGDPRFAMMPFASSMWSYLKELDVFVLPSDWEGLPLALLEAMAAGVPQVVTAVGGSPEAVTRDTGRVVAPGDPAGLAAAIGELVADPAERARLSDGSRARHRAHFAMSRMVAETAAVYDELVR